MIRALSLLLCLLGAPLLAMPVAVTSGEHDGFTRVVLNFGAPIDWQFGRTADGYEFRPADQNADYDLSDVFNLIGKSRLAAIAQKPSTSRLEIGFACACHAIPFEFRPGIIVIDLRDGPPPKGSSFEEALAEIETSPADPVSNVDTAQEGVTGGYNWALDALRQLQSPKVVLTNPTSNLSPQPSTDPSLQPLRDQLLRQLSRGAADGVIDLELPPDAGGQGKGIDSARVKLGEMPGLRFDRNAQEAKSLGEEGTSCVPETELNIDAWGTDAPVAEQFSNTFTGLLGEFDRPNPDAVIKSVEFLLYIGFGIEADQMISAFGPELPKAPILRSMARVMDGDRQSGGAFDGQLSCDTPAALWSLLSKEKITSGETINTKAVILAFSNLPIHLRQLLGPEVIKRFLDFGDTTSAETVRAAIMRGGGEKNAALSIAEAKIDLAKGNPESAQIQLETAYRQPGVSKVDTLMDMVDSLVAQGLPIEVEMANQLQTFQREFEKTQTAPLIARALSLARASSGDFGSAFEEAKNETETQRKVWEILARLGADIDILNFAVLEPENVPSDLDVTTANQISGRLLAIGLPDTAIAWIERYPDVDAEIRAKVHLEVRDGRAALLAATEVSGEASVILQAQALQLLGDHLGAAQEFIKIGAEPEAARSFAKAGQWDRLREAGENGWTPVLNAIDAPLSQNATPITGPLSAGQNLLTQSTDTRAVVERLLSDVPSPP